MDTDLWFFGYHCDLTLGEHGWFGVVTAPRSHPIRLECVLDADVFLMGGAWCTLLHGGRTYAEALDDVRDVALRLSTMQKDWDSLSPYEREYLVR